jgi:hypothetical protein
MKWFSDIILKLKKEDRPCKHVWKELPWYLDLDEEPAYDGSNPNFMYHHQLIATYVCTKCGTSVEKTLSHDYTEHKELHDNTVQYIKANAGDQLKPKFIIKAEIERIRRHI